MTAPKRPVLVAMSGGVDSSVTAALLQRDGYEVTGVTMKLWGGESDTGCCSVSDVNDARRVADQLGIEHHVFNFGDEFDQFVVDPYVASHSAGQTPNPCIECNRHLKFDKLLRRASALGFDLIATGHHARIVDGPDGTPRVARGADEHKDQSYVLHMLGASALKRTLFPLGDMSKADVRELAQSMGLRTATKPDSQDVCFISRTKGGRHRFLEQRVTLTPGRVVDSSGVERGTVDAVELVTIGQRKGLGIDGAGSPVYATDIDIESATVTVGGSADLLDDVTQIRDVAWVGAPVQSNVLAQTSAHGTAAGATIAATEVRWVDPHIKIAPGQSVVFYVSDMVVGSALAS